MSAAAYVTPIDRECARVALLGRCAADLRRGVAIEDGTLARLRELQAGVDEERRKGALWRRLADAPLSAVEYDLLACTVAPELDPRIGWIYQELQPTSPSPYPSPALVLEILATPPHLAGELHAALSEDAPLRRLRLVELDASGLFSVLRPGRGVTARLLDAPPPREAPPGATRMHVEARLSDLVLPADRIALLRELLLWVQHRRTVVEAWGGRATGGPVALFAGASGTGKTLAAAAIAGELGWPAYRVDLGALVSKYIGETEKNVSRLLAAAHGQQVVLVFDEADSLFGRRGDVKEARDRYANLEVSHLLARIEEHDGPCVLTTNLREHLDPAFLRRFQVTVDFPRPDAAARSELWRAHLPPRAPLADGIEPELLARSVALTGGGIRNAALYAAYLAAGGRGAIGMKEIALAVRRELAKDGRAVSHAELGQLARYLEEGTS